MVAVTLLCVFGVGALLAGRVSADDPCLCSSSQVRAAGSTHTLYNNVQANSEQSAANLNCTYYT